MAEVDRIHAMARCESCPLWGSGTARSAGPLNAKVAIVSRSPGTHDVRADRPFSGPSGKILEHLLTTNGVDVEDTFRTNVVLCKTEKPPQAALDACRPRLIYELEQVAPDVIIAAGAEPVKEMLFMGLKEARGQRHARYLNKIQHNVDVVATFNPAVVMRKDGAGVFPDVVSDFRRALNDPKVFRQPTIHHTDDPRRAAEWLDALASEPRIACDIESTGLSTLSSLVCIGFAASSSVGYVLGRHLCASDSGRALLTEFFSNYEGRVSWHNGKFDTKILRQAGIPAPIDDDTLLLSYALDERGGIHDLDYLLQDRLDWPDYTTEEVKEAKKHGFQEAPDISIRVTGWTKANRARIAQGKSARVTVHVKCSYKGISDWPGVYRYNGYDTVGSYQLAKELEPLVEADEVTEPYRFMIRASNALVEVERRGIHINVEKAQELLEKEVKPRLRELTFTAEGIVGGSINLNSPLQVARVLYDNFGLSEPVYRPNKERSTDSFNRDEWLRIISNPTARDFIECLDEFKKLAKLGGTYLEGMVRKLDADGRLRCDLLLHGTETGRTSSRKPNLQNIPRVDDAAKYHIPNIKSIFEASPGNVILQVDYSQAELRCAAIISGDTELQRIYAEGLDLHSEVAWDNFGDGYTKEQRVYAKAVNFGILYGIGEFKLSQELTRRTGSLVRPLTAALMIQNWWKRFPQVREWVKNVQSQARRTGELQSVFGRKRRFPLITDDNIQHTLKEAVNFCIQSPASDLTIAAICELVENEAPVWLGVHDSILLEVPEDELDRWAGVVKRSMENQAYQLLGWEDIPFIADVQWGYDWGHLNDYEVAA